MIVAFGTSSPCVVTVTRSPSLHFLHLQPTISKLLRGTQCLDHDILLLAGSVCFQTASREVWNRSSLCCEDGKSDGWEESSCEWKSREREGKRRKAEADGGRQTRFCNSFQSSLSLSGSWIDCNVDFTRTLSFPSLFFVLFLSFHAHHVKQFIDYFPTFFASHSLILLIEEEEEEEERSKSMLSEKSSLQQLHARHDY